MLSLDDLSVPQGTVTIPQALIMVLRMPFTEPRKPRILTKQVPVSLLLSQRGPDGGAPWEIPGGLIKDEPLHH